MTKRFAGWRILALATLVMGFTGPGQTIGVSVFVDHFADDLDLSKNAVTGCYLLGTLTGSLSLPTVGRWIDRYGVRRSMLIVASLFSLGLVYMSGVQGLVTLAIGFLFIRMLGQGALSLTASVSVSLWFERRRGLALGIAMTVSSAIMALVPVALTFVIDEIGWRQAWLVAGATVAVVVIPIAFFGMIDRPSSVGQFPDGVEPADEAEAEAADWGVDRDVAIRTRAFWILALASTAASMLVTALNFHQIALLGESGFTETEAAIMFLPQVIGSSIGSPTMGVALDRVGTRYAPVVTLLMLSASLALAGWVTTTAGVVFYAMWLGLQSGMVRTVSAALVPAWFGTRHLGAIQGALTFLGVMGSAAGPFAFALTETATGSWRETAMLWAIAPLVAALFATSKRPIPTR